MAYITTQPALSDRPSATSRFFKAIGDGIERYVEMRSRVHEIEALQRKSDAELARMGLTRDQIVRHVFADRLYL